MATWFTADTHFGHANIIKYCHRPFMTTEEAAQAATDPRGKWRVSKSSLDRHDSALIDAINERVGRDDDFFVVGDFCMGDRREARRYRDRIVCRNVYLVRGNHDDPTVDALFSDAFDYHILTIGDTTILLNHYPSRDWVGRDDGAWLLYGHVHARLCDEDRIDPTLLRKDVGVDACDYRPWSLDDLAAYMAPREAAFRYARPACRP